MARRAAARVRMQARRPGWPSPEHVRLARFADCAGLRVGERRPVAPDLVRPDSMPYARGVERLSTQRRWSGRRRQDESAAGVGSRLRTNRPAETGGQATGRSDRRRVGCNGRRLLACMGGQHPRQQRRHRNQRHQRRGRAQPDPQPAARPGRGDRRRRDWTTGVNGGGWGAVYCCCAEYAGGCVEYGALRPAAGPAHGCGGLRNGRRRRLDHSPQSAAEFFRRLEAVLGTLGHRPQHNLCSVPAEWPD